MPNASRPSPVRISYKRNQPSSPLRKLSVLLQPEESEDLVARIRGRIHDLADRIVLDALVGLNGQHALKGQGLSVRVARGGLHAQELGLLARLDQGIVQRNDAVAAGPVEIRFLERIAGI